MNNCEKKLDALIDALGFDVEAVDGDVFQGVYSGREVYNKEVINYKLTKRDDVALVKAMDRAIELMYAEFSWVDPEILAAFELAGANR